MPNSFDNFTIDGISTGLTLLDFWSWNQSSLLENRTRGIMAEFIVMKALEIHSKSRIEWDDYDVETESGLKIEVKSAAYLYSWEQKGFSKISLCIKPKSLNDKRPADVYVFCLLMHKDRSTINPMCLDQWEFYVVCKNEIEGRLQNQKTLSLSTFKLLSHIKCSYKELKQAVFTHETP
jgi:hypothetical protein